MASKRISLTLTLEYDPKLGTTAQVVERLQHMLATTPCAALTDDLGVGEMTVSVPTGPRVEIHWWEHTRPAGRMVRTWNREQAACGAFDVVERAHLDELRRDPRFVLVELYAEEDDVPFEGEPTGEAG